MPGQNARGDWNGEGQKPPDSCTGPISGISTEMHGSGSTILAPRFSDQLTQGKRIPRQRFYDETRNGGIDLANKHRGK